MERLITWTQHGPKIKGFCMVEHDFDLTECRILGNVASRLGAYEDSGLSPEEVQKLAEAKAEGRLRVLPCKPGDTIYRPDGLQYSWQIVSITIYPDEIIFTDDSDNIFGLDNIGKTIFFTREEAEKALGEAQL